MYNVHFRLRTEDLLLPKVIWMSIASLWIIHSYQLKHQHFLSLWKKLQLSWQGQKNPFHRSYGALSIAVLDSCIKWMFQNLFIHFSVTTICIISSLELDSMCYEFSCACLCCVYIPIIWFCLQIEERMCMFCFWAGIN